MENVPTVGGITLPAADNKSVDPRLDSGSRLVIADRYYLTDLIGRGASGRVYRAIDLRWGRPVAVKLISVGDSTARSRIEREIRIASGLRHPGLLAIDDSGSVASPDMADVGELFIVTELLSGGTLRSALPCTRSEAVWVGMQLATALAYAHEAGIIHRDVKPENVLMHGTKITDGIKLCDFGLARREFDSMQLTQSGTVIGTPGYIAPETIVEERVGPPADVFAVGAMLFEMIAGRLPFEADTVITLLYRSAMETAPSLGTVAHDCPEDLVDLVDAALQRNPQRRPTMEDLARQLRQLLYDPSLAASDAVPETMRRLETSVPTLPSTVSSHDSLNAALPILFGREALVEQTLEAIDRARRGSGKLGVVLVGPPGAGKSRLARALNAEISLHALSVVAGQATSGRDDVVYGPLVEGLRAFQLTQRGQTILKQAKKILEGEHAVLRPLLADILDDVDIDTHAAEESGDQLAHRVERALGAFLGALAASEPTVAPREALTVLIIDDFPMADAATIRFIESLIRRFPGGGPQDGKLFLILVARDDSADLRDVADTAIQDRWNQIFSAGQARGSLDVLHVGGLDLTAAREMVRALLGTVNVEERLVDRILAQTGRLPRFIQEGLTTLRSSGQLRREGNRWRLDESTNAALQSSASVVAAQLNRLSPETRRILASAALAGNPFNRLDLEILVDDIDAIDEALTLAQRRGLIEIAGVEDRYHFVIPPLATGLLAELSTSERREMHDRLGLALERRGVRGVENLVALANHFNAGRDRRRALRYAWQAGSALADIGAVTIAISQLERARDLAAIGIPAPVEIGQIHLRLGQCYLLVGRLQDAIAAAETASELLATSLEDGVDCRDAYFEAVILHTRALDRAGQITAARSLARGAIDGLSEKEEDLRVRASLLLLLAPLCEQYGEHDKALEIAQNAADIAVRVGDSALQGRTYDLLTFLKIRIAEWEGALHAARTGYDIWNARRDHYRLALNALNHGSIMNARGDWNAAERLWNEAIQLARDVGHTQRELQATLNLGRLVLRRGDDLRAEQFLTEAISIAGPTDLHVYRGEALVRLAEVARFRDMLSESIGFFEAGIPLLRNLAAKSIRGEAWIFRVFLSLDLHDFDEAQYACDQALRESAGWPATLAEAQIGQALIHARAGRTEEAGELIKNTLAELERWGRWYSWGLGASILARFGDANDRDQWGERARRLAAQLGVLNFEGQRSNDLLFAPDAVKVPLA